MSAEDVARLVLDYVRALLSAPVVAGIVIVFFLLRFRPSLEAVFARLTGLKGAGIEASFEAQKQVAKEEQNAIKEVQEAKPGKDEALTRMARWWAFERIWRLIYKSQILLLRYLNGAPSHTARWNDLMQFHHQGLTSQGIAPAQYPYENYMAFLRNTGLVEWTGDPAISDVEVRLTPLGKEFLEYIATNNYNIQERPF